jgi:hypothetical protein
MEEEDLDEPRVGLQQSKATTESKDFWQNEGPITMISPT